MTGTDSQTTHCGKRGMVLPFEPYSITFSEITYSVDMPEVTSSFNMNGNLLIIICSLKTNLSEKKIRK